MPSVLRGGWEIEGRSIQRLNRPRPDASCVRRLVNPAGDRSQLGCRGHCPGARRDAGYATGALPKRETAPRSGQDQPEADVVRCRDRLVQEDSAEEQHQHDARPGPERVGQSGRDRAGRVGKHHEPEQEGEDSAHQLTGSLQSVGVAQEDDVGDDGHDQERGAPKRARDGRQVLVSPAPAPGRRAGRRRPRCRPTGAPGPPALRAASRRRWRGSSGPGARSATRPRRGTRPA
jgi:hypothetical protein